MVMPMVGGNHLRDAIDLAVGHVERAAYVFDCCFGGHGVEGDDLRDLIAAVLALDVLDDLAAAVHAEVDIDIGHGDALRIEEALEEQLVLERIDVRDLHAVGDERSGGGATAGTYGNSLLAGVADKVPDDHEIAGKLHVLDDADLAVEAGVIVGDRLAQQAAMSADARPRCRVAFAGLRGRPFRSS